MGQKLQLKGFLQLPATQAFLPQTQLGAATPLRVASAEDIVPLPPPAQALTAVLLLQEHFADVAGVDEAKELKKTVSRWRGWLWGDGQHSQHCASWGLGVNWGHWGRTGGHWE